MSPPYVINLDGEINDFQARSDGYCLVTPQLTSFASQNLTQLKRQCRTGAFSVTDGFASILFQSLMLKYVSRYSWLQADRICYPRSLPLFFFLLKCTNMEVLGGGVLYHPSRRAGALPGDVVTDASVLARAPLLALRAVLPGGTQVLTAVQGVGTAQTLVTTRPRTPLLLLPPLVLAAKSTEQRAA